MENEGVFGSRLRDLQRALPGESIRASQTISSSSSSSFSSHTPFDLLQVSSSALSAHATDSTDALATLIAALQDPTSSKIPSTLRSAALVVIDALRLGLAAQSLSPTRLHLFLSLLAWIERAASPLSSSTHGHSSSTHGHSSSTHGHSSSTHGHSSSVRTMAKSNVPLSLAQRLEQIEQNEHAFAHAAALRPDEMADAIDESSHSHSHSHSHHQHHQHGPSHQEAVRMAAALYILRSVTESIPSKPIIQYFERLTLVTLMVFRRFYDSGVAAAEAASFLAQIIQILSTSPDDFANQSALPMAMVSLFHCATHPNNRTRQISQSHITSIMTESPLAVKKVAFEIFVQFVATQTKTFSAERSTPILRLFSLFKNVLPFIPLKFIGKFTELLLHLISTGFVQVCVNSIECIEAIYSNPKRQYPAPLLLTTVQKFISNPPSSADVSPALAYMNMMASLFIKLASMEDESYAPLLPRLVSNLLGYLEVDSGRIPANAVVCLKDLFMNGITQSMIDFALERHPNSLHDPSPLHNVISTLNQSISLRFKANWGSIVLLIGFLFEKLGPASNPLLQSSLSVLENLHQNPDSNFLDSLELSFRSALKCMGPDAFLSVIKINLQASSEASFWIAHLLRGVRFATLRCWGQSLLPIANELESRSLMLAQSGQLLQAKHDQTLSELIWATLPAFCTYPTDAHESFIHIAKTLGTALQRDSNLHRNIVCTALANLISKFKIIVDDNKDNGVITVHIARESLKEIGKFARNFLPILFNIHATIPPEQTHPVQDAISAYASISEPERLSQYFKNILKKLLTSLALTQENDTEENTKLRGNMLDLALSLASALDLENLTLLHRAIQPQLANPDKVVQKKCYKILAAMCKYHPKFVINNIDELIGTLTTSLSMCSISSKKYRLICLRHIFEHLNAEQMAMVPSILGEVVLCTLENNQKTRTSAIDVILLIARKSPGGYEQFIKFVTAGLAGTSPTMICATIVVLSRVLFEFRETPNYALIQNVSSVIMLLFRQQNKDIVREALRYVKALIGILPKNVVEAQLPVIFVPLFEWSEKEKGSIRQLVKKIVEKVIKKIGYDPVLAAVPEPHKKLVTYIRKEKTKSERRKERRQMEGVSKQDAKGRMTEWESLFYDSDDSEDGSDDDEDEKAKSSRSNGKGTWLQTADEDENPLDFLDSNFSSRLLSSGPKAKPKRAGQAFGVSDDGKLLIKEDEEVVEEKFNPYELEKATSEADLDRRLRKLRSDDDDEDEAPKKRATGKHRIAKKSENKYSGQQFRSKKAKGDVRRSGQHEPFAYIPLQPKFLNKRHSTKAKKQFRSVLPKKK